MTRSYSIIPQPRNTVIHIRVMNLYKCAKRMYSADEEAMNVPAPITLSQYTRQQIDAQGISVKLFAARAELGLSHAYQILRDERSRVTPDTLEAVARGLSMTPAELLIGMGRAADALSADEAEMLALYRGTPDEQRPVVKGMLRGLVVRPTHPTSNGRADASRKRAQAAMRKLTHQGEDGPDPNLTASSAWAALRGLIAHSAAHRPLPSGSAA